MPILTIQRRHRELGRIRAGAKSAKGAPTKLDTWRLTSAQRNLIEEAARIWGGTVEPWDSPSGPQFQVITTTDTITVAIPSGQSITQWLELWSGGGCQRRCDGEREILSDSPCLCDDPNDPDRRDCQPTTRFNVMLPELSDLGQWRLESHGFYAAAELGGIADLLAQAGAAYVPARLRLEQRTVKRNGRTNRFAVPVVELPDFRLSDILATIGSDHFGNTPAVSAPGAVPAIEAPRPEATADDWADLYTVAATKITADLTMPQIEGPLRRLFDLMQRVGLWHPGSDGTDALHLALGKRGFEHVGDMRKDALVAFASEAFEHAQAELAKVTT